MKKTFYILLFGLVGTAVVMVAYMGGSDNDIAAYSNGKGSVETSISGDGGQFGLFCMDKAVTYGNLKLVPICGNADYVAARRSKCSYVPLKEAIETQKVIISEQEASRMPLRTHGSRRNIFPNGFTPSGPGNDSRPNQDVAIENGGGNDVNEIIIENTSSDTIFIMGGEVVKGGKQDRVIAQDVVLVPHSGPVALGVFCVEHGRWTPREENMATNNGLTFNGYSNVSAASVRKRAVVHRDQGKVWEEVSKVREANDVSSSTDAYTALEENETYQDNIESYLRICAKMASENEGMIGVIAITGDRVISCDIFACPELFRKEFGALLYSYATDAMSYGEAPAFSDEKVKEYFGQFITDGKLDDKAIEQNGAVTKTSKGSWTHLNMY
jgi:hypothetical protein